MNARTVPDPDGPSAQPDARPNVARPVLDAVARHPGAPAVTFGSDMLTFADLDRRSAALARRLAALGVGRDVLVGVYLDRSAEMVVALLAIARAGGAYVPLDPGFPAARIAFMVADSAVDVVVTDRSLAGALPASSAQVVCLDIGDDIDDVTGEGAEGEGGVATGGGPNDLAYVVYTSGSTGQPNGVEIPNRALVNLVAAMSRRPGLMPADVLVAVTTLSFDMAAPEIWLPLVTGAHMVVASRAVARDPRRLMRLLDEAGATVLQATPATWRMLVDSGWAGRPGLRAWCGGEALPVSLADGLLDRGLELWNLYGPTETTVWATATQVTTRGAPPSIGRPLDNTSAYVLDDERTPVPVGTPGELYIGGAGLARGYLRRPELTAERFVDHPFEPRARVYRTGDLARWRPDGDLDFLGRLDTQVKIRGFRVECGEVEAALDAHPAVRSSVVVAREDSSGDVRLVAYVVPDPAVAGWSAQLGAEVRSALRSTLPAYMVPSAVVALDALPLTPNGKVDRRALPAPPDAGGRSGAGRGEPEPRPLSPMEQALVGIWAEVLAVEEVGVDDDFFDLGGHSLLAVRVLAKVRSELGTDVALRTMFDAPTVAGLAAEISRHDGRGGGAPPLVGAADEGGGEPPLSFAQESLWFLDQMVPDNPFYNLALAYRLSGALDPDALCRALAEIARRHQALRTRFPAPGGLPRQRVAPEGLAVSVEDLRGLGPDAAEAEARRRAGAEAARPFDLAASPVVRARLLRLGTGEHVLLVTVHHIAFDGWSTGVLLRELSVLYGASCGGVPSPLLPLDVQYADYAAWQRRWLQGDVLSATLDHWQARLAGAGHGLELPADRPRPSQPSYRGAMERFVIPAELVARLRALGRSHGATLYMTLLAAFKVLLARSTGADDIVVGGTTAGRNQAELEGLIGLFVNPVVLRTDLSGDPTFAGVLARVRGTTLDALDHADAPFDKVVERIRSPRDPSRNPLFQIAFEFAEDVAVPLDLGGTVAWTDLGGPAGGEYGAVDGRGIPARLDLELFVAAGADGSLDATLVYADELYEPATMARLAEGYLELLDQVVANPHRRVLRVPPLS